MGVGAQNTPIKVNAHLRPSQSSPKIGHWNK
jgi:hypothetical protein